MYFIKPISLLFIVFIFSTCQNESNNTEKVETTKQKTPVSEYRYVDLSNASDLDAKQDWITIYNRKTVPLTNGGEYIASFSLKNNSDHQIKDVDIRLISYDRNDQPVDFREYRFLRGGIPSGLAKEVPYKRPPDYYIEQRQGGEINFEILGFNVKR